MSRRIHETFLRLKKRGESAFMPFMTIGYPGFEESINLIEAMVRGGADLLELGIPFSDPLADGPTIQEVSQIALRGGMNVGRALDGVKKIRDRGIEVPIVIMGYANPFLAFGIARLAEEAKKAGADGFIIPDLPPGEAEDWVEHFSKQDLDLIFFIAPTTSEKRKEEIISRASGFLYCISLTGVTGAREQFSTGVSGFLKSIREKTDLPLALGFGISKPEHVREAAQVADGVIMASAIFDFLAKVKREEWNSALEEFVRGMKKSTV